MKNLTVLGILFLLCGAAFASLSITDYTTSQTSFRSGGQGYITLTVTNPSTGSGEGMTGVLVTTYPSSEIAMSSSENIGNLETSGSAVVTLPFRIKNDSKSGYYSVLLKVSGYTSSASATAQSFYSQSISVPITVVDLPVFSLETDLKTLSGINDVEFTVLNNGGPAKEATLKMNNTAGVALYGTNQIYIGDITKNTTLKTQLDSRSATDGPTDLPVTLTYHDELGNEKTDTVYVRVTVKKQALDLTFTQVGKVITRNEGDMTLKIRNNGDETIENLRIYFTNTSIKLKDMEKLSYGDIAPGAEVSVSARVLADYSPGLNRVPVRVVWTEQNVEREEQAEVPITLTSDADVGAYIETKPAPLVVGGEHTLSILISNLGSYTINNVDVEISSDALESLDISNKQYIGSLANDDFSTVQFKTKVRDDIAPGSYTMDVVVKYRDLSGEWITKIISQPITIHAAESADSESTLIYGGAVVLLAAAVWYFFVRKRKPKA